MTDINSYYIGNIITLTGTFKNGEGAVADPTVVKVTVENPDGEETTYIYETDDEVVNVSTGIYTIDIDIDQSGTWYYRWWSTGLIKAARQNLFEVEPGHAIE